LAKNAAAGPQTVVVNCPAQRLETGSGAPFRGLVYPVGMISYSPECLETVRNAAELRNLLAHLGIANIEQVIADALKEAPVRARAALSPDELRRVTAGVAEEWFSY